MARASSRSLWTQYLKTGSSSASQEPLPQLRPAFSGLILGIDPSLRSTGLALVNFKNNQPTLIQPVTIKLQPGLPFDVCLGAIFQAVEQLIKPYPIGCVALESTVYVQNFQIAHKLGSARGAAIAAAAVCGWRVYEYAPLRIKQAITGYGRASKLQINKTIQQWLQLEEPLSTDEADAAAAAICHALTHVG